MDREKRSDAGAEDATVEGRGEAEEEHPVPGVKHEPEPDAENIMPAEDGPGTL